MKIKLIIFVFIPLFLFLSNTAEISEYGTRDRIKYVKTVYGGCNGQSEETINQENIIEQRTEFSIENDTLSSFISIDYICCAPFTTKVKHVKDSLHFIITDNCKKTNNWCYCRCHCIYTFDFKFIDYGMKKYDYRIILIDPKEKYSITIKQGTVNLNEL